MVSDKITKGLDNLLKKIKEKGKSLGPALKIIAGLAEESIMQNIASHGRWDGNESNITIFSGGSSKWKALAPGTVKGYKAKGWSPLVPTLNRNKNLVSRIEVNPSNQRTIAIMSNSPYAAIHQFGGVINHPGGTAYGYKTKADAKRHRVLFLKDGTGYKVLGKTRPHDIKIPARPYLVFQNEDFQEWTEAIADFYFK